MAITYFDSTETRKLSAAHNPLPDFSYGSAWVLDPVWAEVVDVDFGFVYALNFRTYFDGL